MFERGFRNYLHDVSVKDEHLFEQLSNQIDAAKTSINSLEKTVSGFSENCRAY